jgi:nucleoside-diphosphate-sugar epimerase
LRAEDDVHTNHIHAADLASASRAALWRAGPLRAYNISDDAELKMGEYFDIVADRVGLPRPPRVSRAEAERTLPATLLSFMRESRRLVNARARRELRWQPLHPSPASMLATMRIERTAP